MPLNPTKPRALEAQLVHALGHFAVQTVLDVGANIGQYALRLRAAGYGGRIVSFEPLPEAHAELARRAASDPLWEVAPPTALGARDGEATLFVSADSHMSSLLPHSPLLERISPSSRVVEEIRVPLRRLDAVLAQRPELGTRLFLKLDVQGNEPEVLEGAAGALARIVGLQLEMALVPLYEGEIGYRAMIDRLESLGYVPHLFLPGYYERKLARQVQIDGVFFRAGPGPQAV